MSGRYGHTMGQGPKPTGEQIPSMKVAETIPYCRTCKTSFKIHCRCERETGIWPIDREDLAKPDWQM